METITITKEMASKCAIALVDQHNALAQAGHDSCTIISFRSLFQDLCKLGCSWMISSAIRPVNERNLPLFLDEYGKPLQ